MKKFVLAMLALALVCTGAFATVLEPGLYEGSADIKTGVFRNLDADPALEPAPGIAVGDETRAIVKIDGLDFGVMQSDFLGVPVIGTGSAAPYTADTLTGMLYDLDVTSVVPAATQTDVTKVAFGAGSRYAGAWTDTYRMGGDCGLVDASGGAGGLLVIYDDPTGLSTPDWQQGPGVWVEGGTATGDASIPGGVLDGYPKISDGEPWLIAVLMPLPGVWSGFLGLPATTLLYEEFNPLTGSGYSLGFANIIGGTAANQFETDVFGCGLDVRIEFGQFGNPTDGWALSAQDPIQFSIIPEPASITLLGLGIAGLIGYRRKRK